MSEFQFSAPHQYYYGADNSAGWGGGVTQQVNTPPAHPVSTNFGVNQPWNETASGGGGNLYPTATYFAPPAVTFMGPTAQQIVAPPTSISGSHPSFPHHSQQPQSFLSGVTQPSFLSPSGGDSRPQGSYSQPKVAIPGLSQPTQSFPGSSGARTSFSGSSGVTQPRTSSGGQTSFSGNSGGGSVSNASFVDNMVLGGMATEGDESIPYRLDGDGNPVKVVSVGF